MRFIFINPGVKKSTLTAVAKRIQAGETRFFIGNYYYETGTRNGRTIRRREQEPGRTPTSEWEDVAVIA